MKIRIICTKALRDKIFMAINIFAGLVLVYNFIFTEKRSESVVGMIIEKNKAIQHQNLSENILHVYDRFISTKPAKIKSKKINKTCSRKRKLLFLKTHKTASSTVTNILNRYAETKSKRVLIPQEEYSFNWPAHFNASGYAQQSADLLVNHARYHGEQMEQLFHREHTTYVTILRDPAAQFESQFYFFNYPALLGIRRINNPFNYFLENIPSERFIDKLIEHRLSASLIHNANTFDLGHDNAVNDTQSILRTIRAIENSFDFVMITDLFDESLTLLRRRLCWQIDAVTYFKQNEQMYKSQRPQQGMTQQNNATIRAWNRADAMLYQHFRAKLLREISAEGHDFQGDVASLKSLNLELQLTCISRPKLVRAYGRKRVKGFKLKLGLNETMERRCRRMLTNELDYLSINKERHNKADFVNNK